MCLKCLRYVLPRPIVRTPADFYGAAEELNSCVSRGVLQLVQSSSPLEQIRRDVPLHDHYFYVFWCAKCGREFQFNVDLYHGYGVWE